MADRTEHRARWAATVEAWTQSGLSQRAFAEREGITLHTLRAWCVRLGAAPRSHCGASEPPRFVEVRAAASVPATQHLELQVGHGLVLRFGSNVAPDFVASIIAAVEGRRC